MSYIKTLSVRLHRPGDIEITEVQIEHVWVEDQEDMRINFDLTISVAFNIQEGDYHYDDYEEKIVWLLLECTGDLDKQLQDFNVLNYGLHNGKNKVQSPQMLNMSRCLCWLMKRKFLWVLIKFKKEKIK